MFKEKSECTRIFLCSDMTSYRHPLSKPYYLAIHLRTVPTAPYCFPPCAWYVGDAWSIIVWHIPPPGLIRALLNPGAVFAAGFFFSAQPCTVPGTFQSSTFIYKHLPIKALFPEICFALQLPCFVLFCFCCETKDSRQGRLSPSKQQYSAHGHVLGTKY